MKKQTKTSKLHESLGERHGAEKQSMASRTKESRGAKKGMHHTEGHHDGAHHIHIHHHHHGK